MGSASDLESTPSCWFHRLSTGDSSLITGDSTGSHGSTGSHVTVDRVCDSASVCI
jgi:hypothetical protein